jgi:hypothetical protein
VAPAAPPKHARKAYAQQEVEGVKVYYSPGIVLNQRAMQLELGGFWRFRWLNVAGVGIPRFACCG